MMTMMIIIIIVIIIIMTAPYCCATPIAKHAARHSAARFAIAQGAIVSYRFAITQGTIISYREAKQAPCKAGQKRQQTPQRTVERGMAA